MACPLGDARNLAHGILLNQLHNEGVTQVPGYQLSALVASILQREP